MKRLLLVALAATAFATGAHAQSNASGPFVTSQGELQFMRVDGAFVGMLNNEVLDRFSTSTLTHFDEIGEPRDSVTRTLVETDAGPVLYDFRHRPAVVQRVGRRMTVKRVFWQGNEVVMQSSQGWFRFEGGVLTKLQSTTTTYH
ncbi:hypothetical protein [Paraburkholderia phosphatilytica]|uniref:hypothetical protein n=1 Tax=Paraburkholderia phosphatilytica TaxID=2282883 RepID=UPI000E5004B5|nr:hypothetical protein [Paraburkholderia phosphatilytica]